MAKSKKSGDKFECKWCKTEFIRESSVSAHMCVKKRRWVDKDVSYIRFAYHIYNKFYMMTMRSGPKTHEDFIESKFYDGFVKFGRACMMNEYFDMNSYAEWLIKEGKKLTDWPKDSTYEEFLITYIKRETASRAMERTIEYFAKWSEETNIPWNEYFKEVTPARATHDIRTGKVSPWLLYLSNTGENLLSRLSSEQITTIQHLIDANFWGAIFKSRPSDVEEVISICKEANL